MAKRDEKAVAAPAPPTNKASITAQRQDGETVDQAMARTLVTPQVMAATTIREAMIGNDIDLMSLVTEPESQAALVHGGNLERAESLLLSQAHSLDALFSSMAISK